MLTVALTLIQVMVLNLHLDMTIATIDTIDTIDTSAPGIWDDGAQSTDIPTITLASLLSPTLVLLSLWMVPPLLGMVYYVTAAVNGQCYAPRTWSVDGVAGVIGVYYIYNTI